MPMPRLAHGRGVANSNATLPLVIVAFLVGASRVVLGVHYAGDVLVGQLIAVLAGLVVRAIA